MIAEFIGTFALVFVGVGAVSISPEKGGGLLSIALAFGLTVAVMVSATLHISGGQFNPAVSLALLVTRKMSLHDTLFYILTQLLAAVAAAGTLQLMFGGYVTYNGTPVPQGDFTPMAAMVMEIILTFLLVFVIFGVAVDKRGPNVVAGLLIGLTVTLDILLGGPYTGASMNPAALLRPGFDRNALELSLGLLGRAPARRRAGWPRLQHVLPPAHRTRPRHACNGGEVRFQRSELSIQF